MNLIRMEVVPPRLAVLADFVEEAWPSMDLCDEMLLNHLPKHGPWAFHADRIRPSFRRVATRIPALGRSAAARNADRLLNRLAVFPLYAQRHAKRFDVFHIVDHSYAQLVHFLPIERTGVFCHDLDAFRCLLDPLAEPRPPWFRALSQRILTGLQRAAIVFHTTTAVGNQLEQAGLIARDRLVLAPPGVAPEFVPESGSPRSLLPGLTAEADRPWLLHVGSCIPRKRTDVLLSVAAEVRRKIPELQLVKVGGMWSAAHRKQIARLGLNGTITHLRGLSRAELAEVYRRAPVVLVPSEAEGFGLPVVEALACGARVVASDIPALREAGGPAAMFATVGDIAGWATAVYDALINPERIPRTARLAWAAQFSWTNHAEIIARAYHRLLDDRAANA